MRYVIPLALAAAAMTLVCGCAAAPTSGTATTPDPAALIQQHCTRCHSVQRIKAADHDAAGWAATIKRMQGKGAQVTDAEAAAIAQFLASGGGAKL